MKNLLRRYQTSMTTVMVMVFIVGFGSFQGDLMADKMHDAN